MTNCPCRSQPQACMYDHTQYFTESQFLSNSIRYEYVHSKALGRLKMSAYSYPLNRLKFGTTLECLAMQQLNPILLPSTADVIFEQMRRTSHVSHQQSLIHLHRETQLERLLQPNPKSQLFIEPGLLCISFTLVHKRRIERWTTADTTRGRQTTSQLIG